MTPFWSGEDQPDVQAAAVGDACIDVYLPPHARRFFGGNAVNLAVALNAAGIFAAYAGAVGSDGEGAAMLAALAERGLDVSRAQSLPGPTNRSHTRLQPGGVPEFVHALNPPRLAFSLAEETVRWLAGLRLVASNWLWDAAPVFRALRETGERDRPLLAMDYGGRMAAESIALTAALADVVFISLPPGSAEEARQRLADLYARGPRTAGAVSVALLGAEGSLAYDGEWHACPAESVEVADTLGAGDAYAGAFLAARLRGEPLAASMAAGARAAGETCRVFGGWPGAELASPGSDRL